MNWTLVTCRLQFENLFQVAYDELFYTSVDRDETKAWKNIKKIFVHVQAAFCHASLGTKIHINYGDKAVLVPNLSKVFTLTDDYKKNVFEPILEPLTKTEMEDDSSLNLMVYLTSNKGSGEARGKPCGTKERRFSINQCGDSDDVQGMLTCAHVCIIFLLTLTSYS